MREDYKKFIDKDNMIGNYVSPGEQDDNRNPVGPEGWVDGGDACQRMGMFFTGIYVRTHQLEGTPAENISDFPYINQNQVYDKLRCGIGNYRRHNDATYWYADCDRGSRDQITPNIIFWALSKNTKRLWDYFKGHLLRGLLFTTNLRRNGTTEENHGYSRPGAEPLNKFHEFVLKYRIPFFGVPDGTRNNNLKIPDLTLFEFWSWYIRGFRLYPLYPLLLILDIESFVNSILKRTLVKEDVDVLNHVVSCTLAHYVMPTPWTIIANRYINSAEDMDKKFEKYFEWHRSPKMIHDLWKPIIYAIFKGKL